MDNLIIILSIFFFSYLGKNYKEIRTGLEEFLLDIIRLILSPIRLIILLIFKIKKIWK